VPDSPLGCDAPVDVRARFERDPVARAGRRDGVWQRERRTGVAGDELRRRVARIGKRGRAVDALDRRAAGPSECVDQCDERVVVHPTHRPRRSSPVRARGARELGDRYVGRHVLAVMCWPSVRSRDASARRG
jgi:hypothetical protein